MADEKMVDPRAHDLNARRADQMKIAEAFKTDVFLRKWAIEQAAELAVVPGTLLSPHNFIDLAMRIHNFVMDVSPSPVDGGAEVVKPDEQKQDEQQD